MRGESLKGRLHAKEGKERERGRGEIREGGEAGWGREDEEEEEEREIEK